MPNGKQSAITKNGLAGRFQALAQAVFQAWFMALAKASMLSSFMADNGLFSFSKAFLMTFSTKRLKHLVFWGLTW